MINPFLANESYCAQTRSLDTIKTTIKNSLCFGAYLNHEQIGFARVVTDYAVFAWIMDVFVMPEHQGNGVGKKLIHAITTHPDLQTIKRWGLATNDAHGLYEQYGFTSLEKPEIFMEKVRVV